jgi:hypothetical protein
VMEEDSSTQRCHEFPPCSSFLLILPYSKKPFTYFVFLLPPLPLFLIEISSSSASQRFSNWDVIQPCEGKQTGHLEVPGSLWVAQRGRKDSPTALPLLCPTALYPFQPYWAWRKGFSNSFRNSLCVYVCVCVCVCVATSPTPHPSLLGNISP